MNRLVRRGWLGVILLVAGCTKGDDIVHLQVPRPPEPVAAAPKADAHGPGEPQRLLAAMIPAGADVWFFRMSGIPDVVKEHEPQFDAIVRSLKFGGDMPTWKLPDGWIAEAPKQQFRLKTLRPEVNPKNVEVSVSKLPKVGDDTAMKVMNVNRWRGQLGLDPATAKDLPEFSKEIEVDGNKGLIVDLLGSSQGGGMMGGPMAGGPMAKGKRPAMPEPPAGIDGKISYTLPKDWKKVTPNNEMIKEQIAVTDGDATAEVTIVVLPGRGGTPADNINRWRGQIKLPPIEQPDELLKDITVIEASGHPAALVDIANPKLDGPNRILGVLIPARGATWFLKMRGSDALVGRQKSNFEAFTRSFKIE